MVLLSMIGHGLDHAATNSEIQVQDCLRMFIQGSAASARQTLVQMCGLQKIKNRDIDFLYLSEAAPSFDRGRLLVQVWTIPKLNQHSTESGVGSSQEKGRTQQHHSTFAKRWSSKVL